MESAIVEPLIKVLKFLLDKGAESQAVVGKLKKYRDIELLKRIQAEKIANGEPIEKPVEDKVKRREEKLNEMQKRQLG